MGISLEEEKIELQQRVIQYAKDIKNGEIKAGKKFIQAIDRFFIDLSNEKYYMDWNELLKFNRWASMFKHTKGLIAGQNIRLTDFQLFLAANIFGFKSQSTGLRKFKEAYIQIGRKNAKSQLIAIMTSYVAFLSEEQEEIYISSWTRDQSSLVYNESLAQIGQVDMLRGKFSDSYNMIRVKKNGSVIKPLSREARKTGDGTNPSMAVLDEYKDNLTSELRDTQKTGMIARPNRLLIVITTAGFDLSVPCYSDYQYYSRVLNTDDDAENDEIFICIMELDEGDDVKDESNFIKANPIVATYESGMESLRSELKLALEQPERMRAFLTKNMNVWVDQTDNGYMDMKRWNNQAVSFEEYDQFLRGANIYLGVDASMTEDLTSVGWVAVKDGKFMVGQHSFVPEDKFNERMSRDKVRYDLFVQQGYMTKTPGAVVDYLYLKDFVVEFCSKHNVLEIGYDKWNLNMFSQDLMNEGYPMVEIPQGIAHLSEPTKKFRSNVYDKKIFHNGDPLLKWAIGNAVVKSDPQENIMLGKNISRDRIDPIAAPINAFARAMYDELTVDLNEMILRDDWTL